MVFWPPEASKLTTVTRFEHFYVVFLALVPGKYYSTYSTMVLRTYLDDLDD